MKENKLITRRHAIITGLTSLGGLLLPGCSKKLPPTYGNILRMGDALTYVAHRTLLPGQSLVREYDHRDISSFPAIGTTNPADPAKWFFNEDYGRLRSGAFANWTLSIEGRVARPTSYTLADLQRFPARTQITRHTCEEGWTAIGQWTGVPLSVVLNNAGIMASARFVNFYTYDRRMDSIDMFFYVGPFTQPYKYLIIITASRVIYCILVQQYKNSTRIQRIMALNNNTVKILTINTVKILIIHK